MPSNSQNAQCRTFDCRFMLDHFFAQEGQDSYVIVLEDDLVLSKDALTFFQVSPLETLAILDGGHT